MSYLANNSYPHTLIPSYPYSKPCEVPGSVGFGDFSLRMVPGFFARSALPGNYRGASTKATGSGAPLDYAPPGKSA
jgi:hypothetical protein